MRRDRYGEPVELEVVEGEVIDGELVDEDAERERQWHTCWPHLAASPEIEHHCEGGWLDRDADQPRPCLRCRPHLARPSALHTRDLW